ncbi:MAG TPA: cation diffusion facilitator family transporter, partial [Phototrophicaceae bacterium]|nr:cation diffusion facilitator family transporter [Phototrophicaceae bacterium]
KFAAYLLSGSVGLLSDALESGVNLIAAIVALGALAVAARPADDQHNFGHDKAEYFSSGVEGALILVAALSIAYTSIERLLNLQPLEQVSVGLMLSVGASLINLAASRILLRAGKNYNSITLEADAQHLMTDVWTSAGVVVGIGAVAVTGWLWLDPIVALLVALNIVWSGVKLLKRSLMGLMDSALEPDELSRMTAILERYQAQGVRWHGLRTRKSGARWFLSCHVLVPGDWTVQSGHDLLEKLEAELRQLHSPITITTHLEPLGDPAAEVDQALDWLDPASLGDEP